MAGYVLVNVETGAILGQRLNERSARAFVSISEAYETLAALETMEGTKHEEADISFNAWRLCEVSPVEKP